MFLYLNLWADIFEIYPAILKLLKDLPKMLWCHQKDEERSSLFQSYHSIVLQLEIEWQACTWFLHWSGHCSKTCLDRIDLGVFSHDVSALKIWLSRRDSYCCLMGYHQLHLQILNTTSGHCLRYGFWQVDPSYIPRRGKIQIKKCKGRESFSHSILR